MPTELVQQCLLDRLSLANSFETRRQRRLLIGFSLCIFVSQSTAGAANRKFARRLYSSSLDRIEI